MIVFRLLTACGLAAATLTTARPSAAREKPLIIDSALVTVIEEVEVPARVEGVLLSIGVREGQIVEAGAEVARIDDAEPRLTFERSSVELDMARKQAASELKLLLAQKSAELARVELKRARESVDKYKKSVSETELDRLQLNVEKAELEELQAQHERALAELAVRLKEAELKLARHAVELRRIVSPLTGVVVQINRHAGEWIEPGKTVLRLLRMDSLRVEGFVPAKLLAGDVTGRAARLTIDLPGRPASEFVGRVSFVSPEVNPVNGQVRVWVEVANTDLRLRPGLQGRLTISGDAAAGT
ncbi:MAG: efflux RND transporter periplasmic adaptor subunit [Planctomycetaceae bacterium]